MFKLKGLLLTALLIISSAGFSYSLDAPGRLNISGEVILVKETLKYGYVQSYKNDKSKFKVNDIILGLTDKETGLSYPSRVFKKIHILEGRDIVVTVLRDNEKVDIDVIANDFLGVNITDIFSYVATVTAIQGDEEFVGLSHKVSIGKNVLSDEMILSSTIYKVDYIKANKRRFIGMSTLSPKMYGFEEIGKVDSYIEHGIKGRLYNTRCSRCSVLEVETTTPKVGKAQIYCKSPSTNQYRFFDIDILEVGAEISSIRILDKELLEYNGGLIKGMSGSPVIQNGKLVGGIRSSINKRKNIGRITNIDAMFK